MTTTYTKIAKASGTPYVKIDSAAHGITTTGSPIAAGFFLYLTYPTMLGTRYTNISKATGTNYTKVTKAT